MDINDKITTADEEQVQIDLTDIQTPDAEADAAAKKAARREKKAEEAEEKIKETLHSVWSMWRSAISASKT